MVPPCTDISDFELIRRMAEQSIDPSGAREAWGLFYVANSGYLLRVCTFKFGYLLGQDDINDVVNEAFMRAFDGAETFDSREKCEPEIQRRKCRAWLARIAINLVYDRYRGQRKMVLVDEDEMEELAGTTENPGDPEMPESERLKLIKSGFALLSDIERTVLEATMLWWQPDQQHQRMPDDAMEQLSKEIGKSPENIRKIRSRALKKLAKYVNENLHHEKVN